MPTPEPFSIVDHLKPIAHVFRNLSDVCPSAAMLCDYADRNIMPAYADDESYVLAAIVRPYVEGLLAWMTDADTIDAAREFGTLADHLSMSAAVANFLNAARA